MTENNQKRIAVYSRKSRYTGKGESIENQIELCRQYIRPNFGEKEAEQSLIYEDEGFSGGTLERPRFKQMLKDARNGKISAIVVYRLDRISRSIGDFAGLIEELNGLGVSFISIREQFDTSLPMGRAMMYIASVFSQLERETIAERIRDNLHELAKTGRWLGGVTPTGYTSENVMNVTLDGKIKKACRLKLIPEEADTVKTIFDKFMETGSLAETERYLAENGRFSKNKKPLGRVAIRGILTNPVYMRADGDAYAYLRAQNAELSGDKADFDGSHGVMVYNRTLQKPGKTHQMLPKTEWIAAAGAHEGLISGRRWVRTQELLEENCRRKNHRQNRTNDALLAELIFCGSCKSPMRAKVSGRDLVTGERKFFYLCTGKEKSRKKECVMKNAAGTALDLLVLDALGSLSEDREIFLGYLEAGKKRFLKESLLSEEAVADRRIFELEKEMEGLVSVLGKAAGTPSEAYIRNQMEKLHVKTEELKRRLDQMRMDRKDRELCSAGETGRICAICGSFKRLLKEMRGENRQRIGRMLIERAVWDGETLNVYLKADASTFERTTGYGTVP